ncbi:MAG TPA: Fmu (Sun) domain protein [Chitinophagaceae bacterium]|nr:Fmu (Sun) domain protein [Chitinophagaceae bacterium]
MTLPASFLKSLEGIQGFSREAFELVHQSGEQVTSVRLNPAKTDGVVPPEFVSQVDAIPWARFGYYLSQRPSFTFDPLFHAGNYYVQEASSMFLEQAMIQLTQETAPVKVLDLCASPGGKSTHLQSLLPAGSLLVSNEVIRSRAAVLRDNIVKWGAEQVVVTNNDPKDFSVLESFFDVLVVDAPCSGSGLFRRDPEAIGEWSLNNVQLCSQRQQRILADCWPALKENGLLIFSTCSYSREEDEEIMDWIQQELDAENCPLKINEEWGIQETASPGGNLGYRFWPDKVKGEGFFLACFRKRNGEDSGQIKPKKLPERVTRAEKEFVTQWMNITGKELIKHQQTVYAWPEEQFHDFSVLLERMRVVYSGVKSGELMRDKLVPDHAMAMSGLVLAAVKRIDLTVADAIRYLQRKDIRLEGVPTGWALACFAGQSLGWMNILPGRINNYYPKELRILRDI